MWRDREGVPRFDFLTSSALIAGPSRFMSRSIATDGANPLEGIRSSTLGL